MPVLVIIAAVIAAAVILWFAAAAGCPIDSFVGKHMYAHRGLHGNGVPENSLAAFAKAIEKGYAIETDVQLTLDKQVVAFHDHSLERMCGDKRDISALTYDELKTLRLGGSGERIPLFSELLSLCGGKVPLLIETKNEGLAGELEERLCAELNYYEGQYAVQSFSPFSMRWFYKNMPDVPRGQLSLGYKSAKQNAGAAKAIFLSSLLINFVSKPNFISYNISDLPKGVVTRLKNRGVTVLGWTARTPELKAKGRAECDNIIFENEEGL